MRLIRARVPDAAAVRRRLWPVVALLPLLGVFLWASTLVPHVLSGDEGPLLAAAHRILQGRYAVPGTVNPVRFLWHGPGLPAVLAVLIAAGIPSARLALVSPLLMFVAVLLCYRLLRLRLRPGVALAGAYALGLYAPGYYVLGAPAKEPLALLLSILALDATSRYLNGGRRWHAAVAGLSLGALAMTRLEYGWVIVALLLVSGAAWAAARARGRAGSERLRLARRSTVVCAAGLLACLPWLVYTYRLTGLPFYWGNSGGLSLYWMSVAGHGQLGEWHSGHAVFSDPALARYRPFFGHLASLTPLHADLLLQHVALTQALAHPARYVVNVVANVGRMLVGFPFSFTLPLDLIVGLILINGALLAGMLLAGRSFVRRRAAMPVETLAFLLFAVVGFAIHLFPTAEPRMVVPLVPVPIWLIWQRLPDWLTACTGRVAWMLPVRARASLVALLSALAGIRSHPDRRTPSPAGRSLKTELAARDRWISSPSSRSASGAGELGQAAP